MDTIQIKDKLFTVSIKEQEIQKEVIRVANEINRDLAGKYDLADRTLFYSYNGWNSLVTYRTFNGK